MEFGPQSGAELARRCFVTPQTMSQLVAGLVARALVRRTAHPSHRRIRQTDLTESGRALIATAHARVQAVETRMVARLSEHERQELVRLLQACAHGFEPPD